MNRSAYYIVVDVYPEIGSSGFATNAGAVVGCWVRCDLVESEGQAYALVEEKLQASSWLISKIILEEIVTISSYKVSDAGKKLFEQVILDGFVANFHLRRRETITLSRVEAEHNLSLMHYYKFLTLLNSNNRIYSLFSESDNQWANGVSPDGDEFVPFWSDLSQLGVWIEHWPNYDVCEVTSCQLVNGLLEEINEYQMWVALCLYPGTLSTFHPFSLLDSIAHT